MKCNRMNEQWQCRPSFRKSNQSAGALRDRLAQAGALPPLISMLSAADPYVAREAAAVIRNLATGGEARRDALLAAGCLPPLVGLLTQASKSCSLARIAELSFLYEELFRVVAIRMSQRRVLATPLHVVKTNGLGSLMDPP